MLFMDAEDRLLPKEQLEAKQRLRLIKGVAIVLVAVGLIFLWSGAPSKKESTSTTSVEQEKNSGARFALKSKYAIEKITGHYVTDSWSTQYGERVNKDGTVDTHGFIELDLDGVKRQFWLKFDGQTEEVLRVKIDADLIYSSIGW